MSVRLTVLRAADTQWKFETIMLLGGAGASTGPTTTTTTTMHYYNSSCTFHYSLPF